MNVIVGEMGEETESAANRAPGQGAGISPPGASLALLGGPACAAGRARPQW